MGILPSNPAADQRRVLTGRLDRANERRIESVTVAGQCSPIDDTLARMNSAAENAHATAPAIETARVHPTHLLALVAHELRNPLGSIRNAATILDLKRPDDVSRARLIIEQQIYQMSRMIDDLLDVSRASAGKLGLVLERVRLREVVERAIEAHAPALDRRSQRLLMSGSDTNCELNADPVRLQQVLCNLLGNASKYSFDGGCIRLEVNALECQVALSVSDDGIGISAEAIDHVFEPFMQEVRAASFNRAGLGLGLAVVRNLVEAHGGSVAASSDGIGHGARFVVTLPRIT